MSIKLLSAAWDLDIGSTEKMVLMCLCDHANDEGGCWPSVATISRRCSKGERTVQSALRWLHENGFFTFTDRLGKGRFYRLNPRKICTPAKSAPAQNKTPTPAKSAPHPRKSRTLIVNEPSRTVKPKKTTGAKEHELPDEWTPGEFSSGSQSRAIVEQWDKGDLETQIEHFLAHHRARGSKFKDWQGAWSTWVLNSKKFGGNNHGNGNRQSHTGNPGQRDNRDGFARAIDDELARRGNTGSGQDAADQLTFPA